MTIGSPSPFSRFRTLSPLRRAALIILAFSAVLLVVGRIARHTNPADSTPIMNTHLGAGQSATPTDSDLNSEWQRLKESSRIVPSAPVPTAAGAAVAPLNGSAYESPIISHAAELAMATKQFSRSRSTLEDILERHHGYASRLRMVGQPGGSLLTATLRVPSSEFTSTIADLKTLGNVEHEEEAADEITQRRADLDARLTNAQNTLLRLRGLLAKDGKEIDSGEIRRQLISVNAEIARLEADRIAWQHQTVFANVLLSLREEMVTPAESFGAQFRKAALSGLSDALTSLSALVLFAISYGPLAFVWTLLLFFPGRWIWRMWRARPKAEPAPTPQPN